MLLKMLVAFQFFDNHIEHIFADLEVGFEQSNEVFAIVRIHPDTVLQTYEADRLKRVANLTPESFPMLRNIENKAPPFSIPSLRTISLEFTSFKKAQRCGSLRRQPQKTVFAF